MSSDDFVIKYDARFMDVSRRAIIMTPVVNLLTYIYNNRKDLFGLASNAASKIDSLIMPVAAFHWTTAEGLVGGDATTAVADWNTLTRRLSESLNGRHVVVLGENAPFGVGIPREVYELRTPTFAAKYSKRDWAVEDK